MPPPMALAVGVNSPSNVFVSSTSFVSVSMESQAGAPAGGKVSATVPNELVVLSTAFISLARFLTHSCMLR